MHQIHGLARNIQPENPRLTRSAQTLHAVQNKGIDVVRRQDIYELRQSDSTHRAILTQPVSAPNAPLNQQAMSGAHSFAEQIKNMEPFGGSELNMTRNFLRLQMEFGEFDLASADMLSQFQSTIMQGFHRQRLELSKTLHTLRKANKRRSQHKSGPNQRRSATQRNQTSQASLNYEMEQKENNVKAGLDQAEQYIMAARPGAQAALRAARVSQTFNDLSLGSRKAMKADKRIIKALAQDGLAELEKSRREVADNLSKFLDKMKQTESELLRTRPLCG